MEGLGAFYHCVKGEFVTHFVPTAMVPSPYEHWGLMGSWRSPKINQEIKKLTNNNNSEIWDSLNDTKCTQ